MIDLESIISNANGAGWQWFEGVDDQVKKACELKQKKAAEDQAAINKAWANFAATPDGQKALQQLIDITLLKTVYFTTMGLDPAACGNYGAFREGQNSVAHMIVTAIAEGRGDTAKPRDV